LFVRHSIWNGLSLQYPICRKNTIPITPAREPLQVHSPLMCSPIGYEFPTTTVLLVLNDTKFRVMFLLAIKTDPANQNQAIQGITIHTLIILIITVMVLPVFGVPPIILLLIIRIILTFLIQQLVPIG